MTESQAGQDSPGQSGTYAVSQYLSHVEQGNPHAVAYVPMAFAWRVTGDAFSTIGSVRLVP